MIIKSLLIIVVIFLSLLEMHTCFHYFGCTFPLGGGSLGSLHVSIFALNMALSSETLVQHQKMLGARAPQVPDCRAL